MGALILLCLVLAVLVVEGSVREGGREAGRELAAQTERGRERVRSVGAKWTGLRSGGAAAKATYWTGRTAGGLLTGLGITTAVVARTGWAFGRGTYRGWQGRQERYERMRERAAPVIERVRNRKPATEAMPQSPNGEVMPEPPTRPAPSRDPLTIDNLMIQERRIHDEVLRIASETRRDAGDVLLERCDDSYYGARVAEVLGGPEARATFRARHIERKLVEPGNQRADGKLVRDMSNGRIGVVRASHDGRYLIEFAGGTEVMPACDTQGVGPDPDVTARAELVREDAEYARLNAANCADPKAAAEWLEDAEQADREADRLDASSMDWLAEPGSVHGFQGPPAEATPAALVALAENDEREAERLDASSVDRLDESASIDGVQGPDFKVRDRVQDCIWDGAYTGTVNRVDDDGDLYVTWDGHFAEYQMAPHQVTRVDDVPTNQTDTNPAIPTQGGIMSMPTGEALTVEQIRASLNQIGTATAGHVEHAHGVQAEAQSLVAAVELMAASTSAQNAHPDTLTDIGNMLDHASAVEAAAAALATASANLNAATETATQGVNQRDGLIDEVAGSVGHIGDRSLYAAA